MVIRESYSMIIGDMSECKTASKKGIEIFLGSLRSCRWVRKANKLNAFLLRGGCGNPVDRVFLVCPPVSTSGVLQELNMLNSLLLRGRCGNPVGRVFLHDNIEVSNLIKMRKLNSKWNEGFQLMHATLMAEPKPKYRSSPNPYRGNPMGK